MFLPRIILRGNFASILKCWNWYWDLHLTLLGHDITWPQHSIKFITFRCFLCQNLLKNFGNLSSVIYAAALRIFSPTLKWNRFLLIFCYGSVEGNVALISNPSKWKRTLRNYSSHTTITILHLDKSKLGQDKHNRRPCLMSVKLYKRLPKFQNWLSIYYWPLPWVVCGRLMLTFLIALQVSLSIYSRTM